MAILRLVQKRLKLLKLLQEFQINGLWSLGQNLPSPLSNLNLATLRLGQKAGFLEVGLRPMDLLAIRLIEPLGRSCCRSSTVSPRSSEMREIKSRIVQFFCPQRARTGSMSWS